MYVVSNACVWGVGGSARCAARGPLFRLPPDCVVVFEERPATRWLVRRVVWGLQYSGNTLYMQKTMGFGKTAASIILFM